MATIEFRAAMPRRCVTHFSPHSLRFNSSRSFWRWSSAALSSSSCRCRFWALRKMRPQKRMGGVAAKSAAPSRPGFSCGSKLPDAAASPTLPASAAVSAASAAVGCDSNIAAASAAGAIWCSAVAWRCSCCRWPPDAPLLACAVRCRECTLHRDARFDGRKDPKASTWPPNAVCIVHCTSAAAASDQMATNFLAGRDGDDRE